MRSYLATFLLAALLSLVLTPLIARLALRLGAVSGTGGRHLKRNAIPRLGGVALVFASCLAFCALCLSEATVATLVLEQSQLLAGLGFGALLCFLLGLADDLFSLRASYKIFVQLGAASIAWHFGFRIQAIELPWFGVCHLGFLAYPLTVIWIVGVTNAVNLIDGLDGLAAGVTFFAAATNFAVALLMGSPLIAAIMAAVMGALFGFLYYNFNPARIFMGDSGSYFLGFVLATMSLVGVFQKASTAVSLLVPVFALGLPLFDTIFSIVRRWLQHRPIFSPDRGHLHHRLLDLGLTHRRAVLVLYSLSGAFALLALVLATGRNLQIGLALLGAVVLWLGLFRFAASFEELKRHRRLRDGEYDEVTQSLRVMLPSALVRLERELQLQQIPELLEQLSLSSSQLEFKLLAERPSVARGERALLVYSLGPSLAGCLVVESKSGNPLSSETRLLLQLLADALARQGAAGEKTS